MAIKSRASGFRFRRGSWLKNASAFQLAAGTDTWAFFDEVPDFIQRTNDLTITLTTELRPEQIAKDVYGRYELWWVIAVANGIRMPLTGFYPGRRLRCPDPSVILEQIRKEGIVRG